MDARITWYRLNGRVYELDPTQVLSMVRTHSMEDGQILEFTSTEAIPKGSRLSYYLNGTIKEFVITDVTSRYGDSNWFFDYIAPSAAYVDLSAMICVPFTNVPYEENGYLAIRLINNIVRSKKPWIYNETEGSSTHWVGFVPNLARVPYVPDSYDVVMTRWDALLYLLNNMWEEDDPYYYIVEQYQAAHNCVTGRTVGIRKVNLEKPVVSLMPGYGIVSLVRRDTEHQRYGYVWAAVSANGRTKLLKRRTSNVSLQYLKTIATNASTYTSTYYRDEEGVKSYYNELLYEQSDYSNEDVGDYSVYTDALRDTGRYGGIVNGQLTQYKYEAELDQSVNSLDVGDAVRLFTKLPSYNTTSNSATTREDTLFVSGLKRDEITGKTTYTFGVPADRRIPKVETRRSN